MNHQYEPAPPHTTGYHVSLLPSIQSHHTLTAERSEGRSSSGKIMDEDESVEGRKLRGGFFKHYSFVSLSHHISANHMDTVESGYSDTL